MVPNSAAGGSGNPAARALVTDGIAMRSLPYAFLPATLERSQRLSLSLQARTMAVRIAPIALAVTMAQSPRSQP
jgi:hypothetical protein